MQHCEDEQSEREHSFDFSISLDSKLINGLLQRLAHIQCPTLDDQHIIIHRVGTRNARGTFMQVPLWAASLYASVAHGPAVDVAQLSLALLTRSRDYLNLRLWVFLFHH